MWEWMDILKCHKTLSTIIRKFVNIYKNKNDRKKNHSALGLWGQYLPVHFDEIFYMIHALRYVFMETIWQSSHWLVSNVLPCPLSYTVPEVFGTDRRNQEDYVLRLPTQSFDQRPGNIRQSTLILPPTPPLVPVLILADLLSYQVVIRWRDN